MGRSLDEVLDRGRYLHLSRDYSQSSHSSDLEPGGRAVFAPFGLGTLYLEKVAFYHERGRLGRGLTEAPSCTKHHLL